MKEFDFGTKEKRAIQPGLSVIEASAGTGKTYAISHLLPRLLLDGTVENIDQILLVTYTKAAAGELAERVRKVLERLIDDPSEDEDKKHPGIHRLREIYKPEKISSVIGKALLDVDRLTVSTIHSFCQRTLQTEGALCGLPSMPEVITSEEELIEASLHEEWESRIACNTLAGPIAVVESWNPKDDRSFLKEALSVESPQMIPPPRGFEQILAEIRQKKGEFPIAESREVAEALSLAKYWNLSAPPKPLRERLIGILRNLGQANEQEFIEAVTQLPLINGKSWISKTPKEKEEANKASRSMLEATLPDLLTKVKEITDLFPQLRWAFQCEVLEHVATNVQRRLGENREITFEGLIKTILGALRHEQSGALLAQRLRARYRVALIDESQDTDPRQFEIFNKIFLEGGATGESRMVMIGDPKQAIYAFRGADVNTYLKARDQAQEIFKLTKTFRAPAPLVDATNAFFSRDGSLLKEGLTFLPAESGLNHDEQLCLNGVPCTGRLEAWIIPDHIKGETLQEANKSIAENVAGEIVRILNSNPTIRSSKAEAEDKVVRPKDFAVLVFNRWQAIAVHEALTKRFVPAVRAAGDDVMQSEEATELLCILNALDDPRREGLRRAALATRLLGFDHARLHEEGGNDAILDLFVSWNEALLAKGIAQVFALIDERMNVISRLGTMQGGERRITNFRHLIDLLQAEYLQRGSQFEHVLRWFSQEVGNASDRTDVDERQLQLESDADAVRIITMHTAKGLEFPLVFCPYLWNAREVTGIKKVTVIQNDEQQEGEPTSGTYFVATSLLTTEDAATWIPKIERLILEENLRLGYVALTRAQVKVWIYGGMVTEKPLPPSALDWLLREDNAVPSNIPTDGRGCIHAEGVQHLSSICKDSEAIVCIAPPDSTNLVKWLGAEELKDTEPEALESRRVGAGWVMTSFSSLTREKSPRAPSESSSPIASPNAIAAKPLNVFATAPGGTLMGNAVHGWIEKWDFKPIVTEDLVAYLKKFPFPNSSEKKDKSVGERVGEMLSELRDSRLPGLDCSISEACPHSEASEWHFHLPIKDGLSSSSLARVFAKHGIREYAEMLEALPAENLKGYLHGFLDRIAKHGESWGVIDWKTNRLRGDDYGPESLMDCAMQSHYLLQAHLYLVALRRRLGRGTKIAGAWVVFLRGIHAESTDGILHICPGDDLLSDLDDLFEKPSQQLR